MRRRLRVLLMLLNILPTKCLIGYDVMLHIIKSLIHVKARIARIAIVVHALERVYVAMFIRI